MPSLVCTVCKDLAVPRSGLSGTRSALRDAAAAGCPKCAMLMEGASLIVPGWIDDQGEFQQPLFQSYQSQVMGAWNAAPDYPLWEMGKDEGGPGDSFDLNMKRHAQLDATFDISPTQEEMEVYFRGSRPETCESIIFFTIEDELSPWGSRSGKNFIYDCSMDSCLKQVPQWIDNCKAHHSSCHNLPTDPFLPTRVLFIEEPTSTGVPQVRLILGKNIRAPYMCLSHCWGNTRPLVTVTQNISDRLADIPWENIPRTFRDAIEVTRGLGIKYLWIDSLCIIQNLASDWETESQAMATIYGNAFLTIAATTAKNSSEGLFAEANPHMPRTYELQSAASTGARVFAHRSRDHMYLMTTEEKPSPDLYPLHTRGWTLQEQLLSPRVLHFGPDELQWECNEDVACSCQGRSDNNGLKHYFAEGHRGNLRKNYDGRDLEASWQALVAMYTSRELTVQSDKFAAISGLAKKWRPLSQPTYVAGLWKNDLLYSLTWYSSNTADCRRTKEYRAPSWSWASIEGAIQFGAFLRPVRETAAAEIEIIDVQVTLKTADEMGEVTGGLLTLKGCLVETTYSFGGSTDSEWNMDNDGTVRRYSCSRNGIEGLFIPDVPVEEPGQSYIEPGSTIHCLLVTDRRANIYGIHKMLALKRTIRDEGLWERVGLFRINHQVVMRWFHRVEDRVQITVV